MLRAPQAGEPRADDWVGLTDAPLPLGEAVEWAVVPSAGAVVMFSGHVRDHAEDRTGVTQITYEAYDEQVAPRLDQIVEDARARWPMLCRLAVLHRKGLLELGEASVVVVASSPHRPEAFAAAKHCIDTLKATVPIWKLEKWDGGEHWSQCSHDIDEVGAAGPADQPE